MSLDNALNKLKQQKIKLFDLGLIDVEKYELKKSWGGLITKLPEVPRASEHQYVVVVEVRGGEPNFYEILTPARPIINLKTSDADKYLFVLVKMDARDYLTNTQDFRTKDGDVCKVSFIVTYQVKDARSLVIGHIDPISHLESAIINETRNYFLTIASDHLLQYLDIVKQAAENFAQKECDSIQEAIGIRVAKIKANLQLSPQLQQLQQTMLAGQHKVTEEIVSREQASTLRHDIDKRINNDITFTPYSLREVVLTLDSRMLHNFYTMSWNDAMRIVHEKLAEEKQKYFTEQSEQNRLKIEEIGQLIDKAKKFELDQQDIIELKDDLKERLLKQARSDKNDSVPDSEFLQKRLGSPSSNKRLLNSSNS